MALDQKSVNKNVSAYGVSFSLNAKYSDFKRLMQDFEKNMRFFTVESITIKRPDASESPVQGQGVFDKEALKIGLTFRVHYLKP